MRKNAHTNCHLTRFNIRHTHTNWPIFMLIEDLEKLFDARVIGYFLRHSRTCCYRFTSGYVFFRFPKRCSTSKLCVCHTFLSYSMLERARPFEMLLLIANGIAFGCSANFTSTLRIKYSSCTFELATRRRMNRKIQGSAAFLQRYY